MKRNIFTRFFCFYACCTLLFCGSLYAQSPETYLSGARGNLLVANKQLSISAPALLGSVAGEKQNPAIRVVLRWAEDRMLINTNRTVIIPYKIALKDAAGVVSNIVDNISVNYDTQNPYTDIKVNEYTNYVSATLVVQSGITASIPEDVILELQLSFDRYTISQNLATPENMKGVYEPAKNELLLTWDFLPGAESYDVEFLFIDNPKNYSHIPYDFRNATRVNVPDNYYRVSLAYPKGNVLYRVRGVGHYIDNNQSHSVYGKWNYATGKGDILPNMHNSIRFDYAGLEPGLNWQYTAAYAEDGKRKEVITFFDGSLRNRQQVTLGNTQEVAIVAESFYDHIGRPALQSMPAPTPGTGMRYYGTNGSSTGNFNGTFSKSTYDTDYGITHTLPMDINAGSGKYYSANNPFLSSPGWVNIQQTPKSEGFTYSRQRLLNDGTERIHSSGSVGTQFGLGSGHETKFYYGTPTQVELDRLFGNEAGKAAHYQKRMTVDPNGTATVEYLDMKERVIATSLAGGSDNLLEVDNTPPVASLTDKIIFDSTQRTATRDILVTAPATQYTFHYNFNPAKPLCDTCEQKTGCVDCYYKITFYLRDNERMEDVFRKEVVTNHATVFTESVTLDIGSYQLHKQVELYEQEVAYFWEEFAQRQEKCVSFTPVEPAPCLSECEKFCMETCGDDPECYKECMYNCENPPVDTRSGCQVKYELLKRDMSAGGQYFDNRANLCPLDTVELPYDSSKRNHFLYKIGLHNDPDLLYLMDNVFHINPRNFTTLFDSMRGHWQDSYGDIMVKYHPEYPLYEYLCLCGDVEAFAYYDSLLYNTQDFQTAIDLGLINPSHIQQDENTRFTKDPNRCYQPYKVLGNQDPRFVEETACCPDYTGAQVELVRQRLSHFLTWDEQGNTVYGSIWYLLDDPDHVAQGSGAITNQQAVDYITQVQTVLLPQFAAVYGSIDNAKWVFFRNNYLGIRETVLAQFLNLCIKPSPYYKEPPLRLGQEDWFAGRFPEDILEEQSKFYLYADTSLCRNAPLTHEGFQIRYLFNPIYSLTEDNMTQMAGQAEQDVLNNCLSECEINANGWIEQLRDYIQVACPNLQHPGTLEQFRQKLIDLCTAGCNNNPTADQLIDLEDYKKLLEQYGCNTGIQPPYPLIVYPTQPNLPACGCGSFQLMLNAYDLTFWSPMNGIIHALDDYGIAPLDNAEKWVNFCTKDLYQRLLEHNYNTEIWDEINFPVEFRCDAPNDTDWKKQCELAAELEAKSQNAILLAEAVEDALTVQKQQYRQQCVQNMYDEMTVTYKNNEFLFTLYYYDQANNLIKTVPPKGVKMITDAATLNKVTQYRSNPEGYKEIKPGFVHPAHTMITNYRYNTLNQIIESQQPDHDGKTVTFYDALARPVISQNAKQRPVNKYSYTLYDSIGRITEVGEVKNTASMTDKIAKTPAELQQFITTGTRSEVTKTFYDVPLLTSVPNPNFAQQRLRNRIAAVTYDNSYQTNPLTYQTATHYSYDIHGNVKALLQNITELASFNRTYISINYEYDLISANVNKVVYQKDYPEQFAHRYRYDADNRLTHIFTSKDNIIWERDARYFYYPHGPLSRVELGQKQVQGTDYAYTLQGWIKVVNSFQLDPGIEMGKDGVNSITNLNRRFAQDAMSYSLQYFTGDYRPVLGSGITQDYNYQYDLFNGNISVMTTGLMDNTGSLLDQQVKAFRYDKLNRIKSMQTAAGISSALTNNFATAYTYDFNGNILSLSRKNETSAAMHNISYSYSGKNRLQAITATGLSSSSYQYDSIGNLINDSGESTNITWNLAGKVKSVTGGSTPLSFSYNSFGQRQIKQMDGVTEYYICDAQGNRLMTYIYYHEDQEMYSRNPIVYGTDRLGVYNWSTIIHPSTPDNRIYFARGQKYYELSNHLGNVNSVISDRKIQKVNNGLLSYYLPDVKSYVDYYPFGYQMEERTWHAYAYHFGFNGQEKDDEIYGEGNNLSFEFRAYDSRIGRWWSIDLLSNKYPSMSSYMYCANNPIKYIDPDGRFPIGVHYKMVMAAFSQTKVLTTNAIIVAYGASFHADAMSEKNLHLDNMSDFESIVSGYVLAKYNFAKGMKFEDFIRAGEGLHTVGDFYSHSNYIDLYRQYADKNKLSMDINKIPTLSEAIGDPKLKGFIDNLKANLKTGTFGEGNVLIELAKDKRSNDPNSHGQMNLDEPNSPMGGLPYNNEGATMYDAARATAEKDLNATVKILDN